MTETNTKRFPKPQLFDVEVLERVEKGLEKKNFPPSLLKLAAFESIFFGSNASSYAISMVLLLF